MAHPESSRSTSKKPGKRKRSSAGDLETRTAQPSIGADLPANTINPFSYPPEKLAQFSLAGLSDADEDPSIAVKDFPHRGFGHGNAAGAPAQIESSDFDTDWDTEVSETDADDNATTDTEQPQTASKLRRPPDPQRRHLDVLIRSIEQFLAQGNVEKAAKAFGLALQLRPRHMTADARRDNLWAIGAEIIMREGEESRQPPSTQQEEPRLTQEEIGDAEATREQGVTSVTKRDFQIPRRWGSAANMNKLRAYFDTLIRQHPYDWRYPKQVSALDFNIALYSCEIYNVYSEHTAALAKLDAGEDDEEGDSFGGEQGHDEEDILPMDTLDGDEEVATFRNREEFKLPVDRRDRIHNQTLAELTSISARMDALMREMPYSKNNPLLRLRAAAALYLADVLVSSSGASTDGDQDARLRSDAERQKALRALQTVLQNGGVLDKSSLSLLEAQGEMEEPLAAHLYSTLPIREV